MGGGASAKRRAAAGLAALLALLALGVALGACTSARTRGARLGHTESGVASWYGPGFDGRRTASGETFDMRAMTAAHRQLPFGTILRVTNRDNGRRVEVRINDRGPFARRRILDLSYGAAEALGMIGPGTARVEIKVIDRLPAPLPADAVVATGWLVQLGAFREAERAAALAAELAHRAPEVHVQQDADWHRVVVGPFRKRGKAEERARELEHAGYPAFVRAVYENLRAARLHESAVRRDGSLAGLVGLAQGRPAPRP
jgi:rare lipoprotein A